MTVSTKAFHILSFLADDVDQLCEGVKPWNIHLNRIDRGKNFHGGASALLSEKLVVFKTDFGGVLEQIGAPPAGMRTFFIPVDDFQHFYWRGNLIQGDTVGYFPAGGELDAFTKPGFRVYVVSIAESYLAKESEKIGFDWHLLNKLLLKDSFVLDHAIILSFRYLLERLLSLDEAVQNERQKHIAYRQLKSEIAILFFNKILLNENKEPIITSNRARVFAKFKEYISSNHVNDYSSLDACAYTGASERTLQYVVKEFTQVSPNQFVKMHRIKRVYDLLNICDPDQVKIRDIAMDHGFWHMGQFAADYKAQFGELPSETLGRKSFPALIL